MKLSIWRQFSSNHSTNFTVVGCFPDDRQADQTVQKIQTIIDDVHTWYESLSIDEQSYWYKVTRQPGHLTPPEQLLQDEYDIEWTHSLLRFFHMQKLPDRYIFTLDTYVFVEQGSQTWFGPQPFPELLRYFGADVHLAVDESKCHPDHQLFIDMTCQLPEDATDATILYEMFREDFAAYHTRSPSEYWKISDNLAEIKYFFFYDILEASFPTDDVKIFDVTRSGQTLYLNGIALTHVSGQLESLIQFLCDEGCSQITYKFWSVPIEWNHDSL